jgi:DNA-binding NarL/FixJ family response regulator/Tfp pilus assembly protein PilF
MDEMVHDELLNAGFAAMAARDWATARKLLARAAELTPDPPPDVLEGLAVALYATGAWQDAVRRMERAFVGFRRAREGRRALQAAIFLVKVLAVIGQQTAAAGWERRAWRLVAEIGPCVEEAGLLLARVGCNVPDPVELERRADRALELAHQFSDIEMEVRALADKGLAVVSQGRVDEGMGLLDEAMVAISSGEVGSVSIVGASWCAMLSACERAGDVTRAAHWSQLIRNDELHRFTAVLGLHCQVVYGASLSLTGRWAEAERALLEALDGEPGTFHQAMAAAGLALLRIGQGQLEEASVLLADHVDRLEAVEAMAALHLARGELAAAATVIRRAVRVLGSDRLRVAPLLATLIRVQLARGDLEQASLTLKRLESMAGECSSSEVRAEMHLARGRVAFHAGDTEAATEHLETALALLARIERPHLAARIRLELARALELSDPEAAEAEARAAAAAFARLAAEPDMAQADAMLGRVMRRPPPAPREPPVAGGLSRRELEIAALVAQGLTNRQIADRLFLSVRTVESHVDSALGKLDFRTRTQLATWMTSRTPGQAPGAGRMF